MKKFLFAAAIAMFGVAAQAQIVSSRSTSITKTVTPSTTIWYLRAGLSSDGVGGDIKHTKSATGYDVNFGFQKGFKELNGAYWGMDLGLVSRNYKVEGYEDDITVKGNAIQWSPFTFGWKFEVIDQLAIDAHVGGYASYDLFGGVSPDKYKDNYDWDDDRQKLDAGVKFGVGAWLNSRFNLDFSYRMGMVNMYDGDADDYKVNAHKFTISLGIGL